MSKTIRPWCPNLRFYPVILILSSDMHIIELEKIIWSLYKANVNSKQRREYKMRYWNSLSAQSVVNEKAAVFASVVICVQAAVVFALERRNRQTRVKPEPGPYRIWIPVRTASANWDRRIRHKSPCRGARIGRDSPLFSSLRSSPLPPCCILWMTARHRFLSLYYHHGQINQNTFQGYFPIRHADNSRMRTRY